MRRLMKLGHVFLSAVAVSAFDMIQMQAWKKEHLTNGTSQITSWFDGWNITLNKHLDDLVLLAEQRQMRADALMLEMETSENPSLHGSVGGSAGDAALTLMFVGDSTIKMQAQALGLFAMERVAQDGTPQCSFDPRSVIIHCGSQATGVVGGDNLMHISFKRVWGTCVDVNAEADFVYFGCGLHLLQLIPARPLESPAALDRWLHYEDYLENATNAYRALNSKRVGYLGEAFMTTHALHEGSMTGTYPRGVSLYRKRDPTCINTCIRVIKGVRLYSKPKDGGLSPADICTQGVFNNDGVISLNKRASEVMDRLMVPMVPSYKIVEGQGWATFDAVHYEWLVPLELSHVCLIISGLKDKARFQVSPVTTEEGVLGPGV
ncbi:unnamed protein product [Choristocarpus tenellus]